MDKDFVSLRGGRSFPDEAISLLIRGLLRREARLAMTRLVFILIHN